MSQKQTLSKFDIHLLYGVKIIIILSAAWCLCIVLELSIIGAYLRLAQDYDTAQAADSLAANFRIIYCIALIPAGLLVALRFTRQLLSKDKLENCRKMLEANGYTVTKNDEHVSKVDA